ncbi:MAG TPA: DUF4184 family protein [Mucilaginibacter sp.]|nr:DUF4184 family protein [Mucilaginibacter sp.]
MYAFTLSHPAAVLPFSHFKRLSLTSLVIGSMVPDFDYFIHMKMSSPYGHKISGLIWFDPLLGLLLLVIYNRLVKNKLIDHLPVFLKKRFYILKSPEKTWLGNNIIIILICLVIGAATHLLWDSFTHPTGYFVNHLNVLNHSFRLGHYFLVGYNLLQHISTVIGGLIIFFAIKNMPVAGVAAGKNVARYWLLAAGVAGVILFIRITTGTGLMIGDYVVTAISGGFTGLIVVSVAF